MQATVRDQEVSPALAHSCLLTPLKGVVRTTLHPTILRPLHTAHPSSNRTHRQPHLPHGARLDQCRLCRQYTEVSRDIHHHPALGTHLVLLPGKAALQLRLSRSPHPSKEDGVPLNLVEPALVLALVPDRVTSSILTELVRLSIEGER